MQSMGSCEPIVPIQLPREMLEPCTWPLDNATAALLGKPAHRFFQNNIYISVQDYKHMLAIDVPPYPYLEMVCQ